MQNVGRNDPCPCGSGRKYKKCHGDTQGSATLEQWKRTLSMDQRVMTQVAKLGASRFGDQGFDPFFLEPEMDDPDHEHGEDCDHTHDVMFADVSFPLALYVDTKFGETVGAQFLEHKGKYLAADERAWLQAQLKTRFSLYQLKSLGEDGVVTVENRETGESLTFFDHDLHEEGQKDDLMLARIVTQDDGTRVISSIHPEIVDAKDAEEAVLRVQQMMKEAPEKGDAGSYAQQLALVDAWHEVVYGEDEDTDDVEEAG
jgi:SEC-C motif